MKNNLKGLKRIRNLEGITFIGEKFDGSRVELSRELLVNFKEFVEAIDAEEAGVAEENRAKLADEVSKVLTIPNYSTVIA